jgi:hypothetical protein
MLQNKRPEGGGETLPHVPTAVIAMAVRSHDRRRFALVFDGDECEALNQARYVIMDDVEGNGKSTEPSRISHITWPDIDECSLMSVIRKMTSYMIAIFIL